MYHYTRDLVHSRYPKIKGFDLPLFRQQLEFFKQNFNVVTMEEVLDALTNSASVSSDASATPTASSASSIISTLPQRVLKQVLNSTSLTRLTETQSAPNSAPNIVVTHSGSNDVRSNNDRNAGGREVQREGREGREAAPALLLTFDDGYIDNYWRDAEEAQRDMRGRSGTQVINYRKN